MCVRACVYEREGKLSITCVFVYVLVDKRERKLLSGFLSVLRVHLKWFLNCLEQ